MNEEEINYVSEQYDNIRTAIAKAIKADRTLVDESMRWVSHLIDDDSIQYFDANGGEVRGYARVYTVQTGGSNEHADFSVPISTLNEYLKK